MMKKPNNLLLLALGITAFLVSMLLDKNADLLFKDVKIPFLDFILSIITNFGLVVVVMLIIPSVVLWNKNKKTAYLLWISFACAVVLSFAIKLAVLRQRPAGLFYIPFTGIIDYSFLSMHTMVAFALLPVLIYENSEQKHFWLTFASLVAFSRLYFRFHFLSDVVFGIFAGYFIGITLIYLHEKGKIWKK